MTPTDDLERRLRDAAKDRAQMERETPGAYPRPPRQHIEWQAADRIEALGRELAEAVAAERERCARIAETRFDPRRHGPFTNAGWAIAAAIRNGEAEQ